MGGSLSTSGANVGWVSSTGGNVITGGGDGGGGGGAGCRNCSMMLSSGSTTGNVGRGLGAVG